MTHPASSLVYLFGDQFAPVRRGPVGVEPLPWRAVAGVDARSLGRQVLAAALISLAERRQVILAAGERREDGVVLGMLLDTFREAVLVSRGEMVPGPDEGLVEGKMLEQIQGRTPLFQVIKNMMPFGIEPWKLVFGLVQTDLARRGVLVRVADRRLGGLVRRQHFTANMDLEPLAVEVAEVRRTMDDFKATYSALYRLIEAEIAAAFRQSLDRLW
jgi:hypothetical protein